jgi:transcriptional regulator of acetoin/glycerol metabolism
VEREHIARVLAATSWNVSAAARHLEIQRTHLHQRISDLGLERPSEKATPEEET